MSASDPVFGPNAERPFILVFANEKGGTGKSILSFHAIVSLLRCGYRVGSIDADVRQGTLSRYLENRAASADNCREPLPLPEHVRLGHSDMQDEASAVCQAQSVLAALVECDFVVIDTPGAVRLVWEASNRRVADGLPPTDWMVLRNRLTHIESRNKRDIADLMQKLAARIGFRTAAGFGERSIYRELFHSGLTVLDTLPDSSRHVSPSHSAAAGEMARLLREIGVEDIGISAG
jgi:chromosome partitioning protein